jgi:hypothetical protein
VKEDEDKHAKPVGFGDSQGCGLISSWIMATFLLCAIVDEIMRMTVIIDYLTQDEGPC